MNRLLLARAVMLAVVLLAGCGQKGPLYLPGDRSEVRTEIPPVGNPQAPDEVDADDDDTDDGKPDVQN